MFPFVVSYDAPENATNVSTWLARPAGKHGFVRAKGGHLATDAGPARFWATNLCFEACFPTHEQAERVAARLARFGTNCVRLHHMDSHSIWGKSPDKLTIDPEKLERLDYLIYQLKLHGIYTNINLHVSRWFDEKEGFPHREGRPQFDKGLGNFEPRMIELQKRYARDLLTHVNPYTKTAYTGEPAIAFVEISNEDSLFSEWQWGNIDRLPDPYATTFRKLWNGWLRKKYGTTEKLRAAWNVGSMPLGAEMLTNGDFSKPPAPPWNLERDEATRADWSVQPGGPNGRPCLRVAVERMGRVSWTPQFTHVGLAVRKDTPYTLACWLRSDAKRSIGLNCMMAHDPWRQLGFYAHAEVGPEWKPVRFTFLPSADEANARITFTSLQPGTFEVAEVSLRPGGIVGLQPGQRLEDDTVPVLLHGQMSLTAAARSDFVDFLWDTERDYWWGMHRFLKDELKVQSLVAGTQLGYSPVHVQAGLDYIDSHSYWQHPHFPGRPWDPGNWLIHNIAMVNTIGGTLTGLASRRVQGKPYTVSEYNHPAPNAYAAEGFPMIAAFGAFQGWDAIYTFAYNHSPNFEPRAVESYFDIKCNTDKLAHMPACAAMFLRGDVAPAREWLRAPLAPADERRQLHESMDIWSLTTGAFGLPERLSLVHGIGLDAAEKPPAQPKPPSLPEGEKVLASDTGELRWDASEPKAGCFTASARRSKLFSGFVRGRTFDLGGVKLTIGKTRLDWATVTMTCLDGEGFERPGRILIAVTGWVQNKDWRLRDLGGERITLDRNWGTEPVMCEGVPAEVVLPVAPERVRLYPLDESGNRRDAIPVAPRDGKALLRLGPEHKTVWYEVEVR